MTPLGYRWGVVLLLLAFAHVAYLFMRLRFSRVQPDPNRVVELCLISAGLSLLGLIGVSVPDQPARNPPLLDANAPDINNAPDFKASDINSSPDFDAPDLNAAVLNAPDLNAPDLNAPDLNAPDFNAPTAGIQDSNTPEISPPDDDPPDLIGEILARICTHPEDKVSYKEWIKFNQSDRQSIVVIDGCLIGQRPPRIETVVNKYKSLNHGVSEWMKIVCPGYGQAKVQMIETRLSAWSCLFCGNVSMPPWLPEYLQEVVILRKAVCAWYENVATAMAQGEIAMDRSGPTALQRRNDSHLHFAQEMQRLYVICKEYESRIGMAG